MLFTDRAEALAWLTAVTQADSVPVLPAGEVDRALDASQVVDSDGRAPVDAGYVPTFNVAYAAALLFDVKASLAVTGGVLSFTSEGSTVTRKDVTSADFTALAVLWRSKAFPSGPVTVIDLGYTGGPVPRSAFEGVTPDASPRRAGLDA